MEKIYQKPLDKYEKYDIIELRKAKQTNKNCFNLSNKKGENSDAKINWGQQGLTRVPPCYGEEKKERRVRKVMIPSHSEAKA